MIFLTTGTQLPFDRLVRAVDAWVGRAAPPFEVFGQVLPPRRDAYVPRNFRTVARLSPDDYARTFDGARLIISHAGMGTILTALSEGRHICVMPRQLRYDEHRNDHQLATVERLKGHPALFRARDETELPERLDAALDAVRSAPHAAIDPFAAPEMSDALRRFILTGTT